MIAIVSFSLGLWLGVRNGAIPASVTADGHVVIARPMAESAPMSDSVRGIYVVRHSLRTARSIDEVIQQALLTGANTLFVQVNGRGEAYYTSNVTVKAPDVDAHFDPLVYVLERAKATGLAVHAWINAYTAGMLVETPDHPDHILNRHPEWVTVDRTGRSLWDYTWQEAQVHVPARMLDPGVPGVEEYVVRTVLDVTKNYAVDGVHLDYIRYPSTRFGFHPDSVARFAADHGFDPLALIREAPEFVARNGRDEFERRTGLWDGWRRDRVTDLVARLRSDLHRERPDVVFSVAVEPDAAGAVNERLQDWPRWIRDGLIDAIVPMAYSPDGDAVSARIADAVQLATAGDVAVYAALGAYMMTDAPSRLAEQMEGANLIGASGTIVFSHDTLRENGTVAAAVAEAWSK